MGTMTDRLDADAYLGVLDQEGGRLVEASRRRGPAAPIDACPGWTVSDLATHLGVVYRWVTLIVEEHRSEPPRIDGASLADPNPSDADGVMGRLEAAHDEIVQTLRKAPTDLRCWTTWAIPGAPRDFWLRRMVHETLVHRIDAEDKGTTGPTLGQELDAMVAADGIDEMVCGFARRFEKHLRAETDVVLTLRPTDADGSWWIRMSPDAPSFGRGPAPDRPAAHVEGTAGELLLLLWNRRSTVGLDVAGDPAVLEAWRQGSHL
jgi:uncharacterized protein (TIGR03083 family)